MEKNDVTSFFYYMWNAWCKEECETVFAGTGCVVHIWNKWVALWNAHGSMGAIAYFMAELDNHNRDLLVGRAITLYDRGTNINPENNQ